MDVVEPSGFRHLDRRLADLGVTGHVLAGAGVDQGELGDALRRLPHHLEGDVAAHGEPDQGKFGRCGGEQAPGDVGNGLVARMVRHDDGVAVAKGGDLRLEEIGGAVEAGDEDQRQAAGHIRRGSDRHGPILHHAHRIPPTPCASCV